MFTLTWLFCECVWTVSFFRHCDLETGTTTESGGILLITLIYLSNLTELVRQRNLTQGCTERTAAMGEVSVFTVYHRPKSWLGPHLRHAKWKQFLFPYVRCQVKRHCFVSCKESFKLLESCRVYTNETRQHWGKTNERISTGLYLMSLKGNTVQIFL